MTLHSWGVLMGSSDGDFVKHGMEHSIVLRWACI